MSKESTCVSKLQIERGKFKPVLPDILKKDISFIKPVKGKVTNSNVDQDNLRKIFKNTYGFPKITFRKGVNKDITKKPIKVAVVLGKLQEDIML